MPTAMYTATITSRTVPTTQATHTQKPIQHEALAPTTLSLPACFKFCCIRTEIRTRTVTRVPCLPAMANQLPTQVLLGVSWDVVGFGVAGLAHKHVGKKRKRGDGCTYMGQGRLPNTICTPSGAHVRVRHPCLTLQWGLPAGSGGNSDQGSRRLVCLWVV